MATLKAIDALLESFRQQRPLRGGSLIITLFGDSISQHGNSVWLGSIIKSLEPFGLNSRLIRTAVHRLSQEDWLTSHQVGRRSYYSFTQAGLRRYEKAAQRIYAGGPPQWDGGWTLVICDRLQDEGRERLRKELSWSGYGEISNSVFLHAGGERSGLSETLRDLGLTDNVVVMDAHTAGISSEVALRQLAQESWPLEELAQRYRDFLARFRPLLKSVQTAKSLTPEQAFQLRTLLVHEFRRILLRDSDLPAQLLPANWVGHEALQLVADTYRLVGPSAENYLKESMETAGGALPAVSPLYKRRFGGL
jgi:phenylacetic acid degradation operon negative regulatory protein